MPWTPASFADRHNHSLHDERAEHASRIANAVLRSGAPEGESVAVANKWAQHHAAGGIVHRDYGGATDPTQSVGGVAPTLPTQNPMAQGVIQRYASLPTEKLSEMAAMMGGTQQGQVIQRLLEQRRAMPPQPQAQQQAAPVQQARGGATPKRAAGGASMGISPGEGSPWWTRAEARGADSGGGFLHGVTPGRADSITTTAPGGSHIIPADVIAGLGEGNSLAGARVMQGILDTGPGGIPLPRGNRGMGAPRPPPAFREPAATGGAIRLFPKERKSGGANDDETPVALSDGEFAITPHHVAAWGKGDIKKGHKLWDDWIVMRRKKDIATLKKLPGPVKT